MTSDARMFNSINTNGNDGYDSITFGDNGKGKVKGLGKIAISNDMSISNVLLVDDSNLIFKGFRYENLYLVDFNASEAQLSTCLFTKSSMSWLWHRKLGHVGMK